MNTNITVTVNVIPECVTATDADKDRAMKSIEKKINEVALETIRRQQRPGGILWRMNHPVNLQA